MKLKDFLQEAEKVKTLHRSGGVTFHLKLRKSVGDWHLYMNQVGGKHANFPYIYYKDDIVMDPKSYLQMSLRQAYKMFEDFIKEYGEEMEAIIEDIKENGKTQDKALKLRGIIRKNFWDKLTFR